MDEKEKYPNYEAKQETIKGNYSNLAIVSHSSTEFVIDFALMLPGFQKPMINDRIILTPEHAKRLFMALQDNLSKYESKHGQITQEQRGITLDLNNSTKS